MNQEQREDAAKQQPDCSADEQAVPPKRFRIGVRIDVFLHSLPQSLGFRLVEIGKSFQRANFTRYCSIVTF